MSISDQSERSVAHLVRTLLQAGQPFDQRDVDLILNEIATASFDPRTAQVPLRERGLSYGNRVLLARDQSLFVHLVRRVLIDDQWANGTSAEQYLEDLHRAARTADTRLAIYARRGGYLAATLTPTDQVVPASRRGLRSLPELLVVYSADRGIIVTGYQVSSRDVAGIPEDARWLR